MASLREAAGSGLSASPNRVEVDLPDRKVDVRVMISGSASEPTTVALSISGLAHDLDGTPQFPDEPASSLTVSPNRVSLEPGASVEVRVSGSIPKAATALYAGLVAAIDKPLTAGVDVVTRIGVPLLLRGPSPFHPAATIEDLSLPPVATGQPPRVEAVVRNTGDVHIRPTGRFTILKGDKVVATAVLKGEAVLPGLARRLGASWTPSAGLQGPLTARLVLDAPTATGQRDGLTYTRTGAATPPPAVVGTVERPPPRHAPARTIVALIALLLIIAVAAAGATRAGAGSDAMDAMHVGERDHMVDVAHDDPR